MGTRRTFLVAAVLSACAAPSGGSPMAEVEDAVVALACDAQVVMLGEDSHHGGGTTQAFKAGVIPRLVNECGFDTLAFEASVYEFAELRRRAESGDTVTEADVVTALGYLWGDTEEVAPLARFVARGMNAGTLRVIGLDYRLGGFGQTYTAESMASDVFEGLGGPREERCVAALREAASGGDADRRVLSDCYLAANRLSSRSLSDTAVSRGLVQRPESDASVRLLALQTALLHDINPAVRTVGRSPMMAKTLVAQTAEDARVVVWASSAHTNHEGLQVRPGGEALPNVATSLAGSGFDRPLSIGFDAAGGAFRTVGGEVKPWPVSGGPSLADGLMEREAALLTDPGGVRDGAALGASVSSRDWSELFDAVVVFREMQPATKRPRP